MHKRFDGSFFFLLFFPFNYVSHSSRSARQVIYIWLKFLFNTFRIIQYAPERAASRKQRVTPLRALAASCIVHDFNISIRNACLFHGGGGVVRRRLFRYMYRRSSENQVFEVTRYFQNRRNPRVLYKNIKRYLYKMRCYNSPRRIQPNNNIRYVQSAECPHFVEMTRNIMYIRHIDVFKHSKFLMFADNLKL